MYVFMNIRTQYQNLSQTQTSPNTSRKAPDEVRKLEYCKIEMVMLLNVHMTSVLFLVQFNNFTLTMGFYWSYTLLLLD